MGLHIGFVAPSGVPMGYWDLADDRMPFCAYGGPERYAEGSEPGDKSINIMAARLMVQEGRDKWQMVQAAVVRMLRHSEIAAEKWLVNNGGLTV